LSSDCSTGANEKPHLDFLLPVLLIQCLIFLALGLI
jgi:hypothetical protein